MEFSDIFFTIVVPFLAAAIVGGMAWYLATARGTSSVKRLSARLTEEQARQRELQQRYDELAERSEARGLLLLRWQEDFTGPLDAVRTGLRLDTVIDFQPPDVTLRPSDQRLVERVDEEIRGLSEAGVKILPGLLLNLGLLHYVEGRTGRARELFARILESDSTHQDARANLGIMLLKERRYDEAAAEFEQLAELAAHRFDAFYGLGLARMKMGQAEGAVEALTQAISLRPEEARVYCELGAAYAAGGEMDRAMESVQVALKLSPRLLRARLLQQELLIRNGAFDDAIDECRKYLDRRQEPEVYYNLAAAFALKGDREQALDALRSAVSREDELRFRARDDRSFAVLRDSRRFNEILEGRPGLF